MPGKDHCKSWTPARSRLAGCLLLPLLATALFDRPAGDTENDPLPAIVVTAPAQERAEEVVEEPGRIGSTVGFPVQVRQLMLPGSVLASRPLESRSEPVVVRVLDSFPHGSGFRYDLEVTGFEPGRHDLCRGLIRADGSTTADLPVVWVEISSQLPAGQVQPHDLKPEPPTVTAAYVGWLISATGLWLLGLAAILFWGRAREYRLDSRRRQVTVADRLRPLLEQAATGQLASADRAALERVLLAFWRKKLRLEGLSPAELIPRVRQDLAAGPLWEQLELWLHAPPGDEPVDWQGLLAPFRSMNLADLEL